MRGPARLAVVIGLLSPLPRLASGDRVRRNISVYGVLSDAYSSTHLHKIQIFPLKKPIPQRRGFYTEPFCGGCQSHQFSCPLHYVLLTLAPLLGYGVQLIAANCYGQGLTRAVSSVM